MIAGSRCSLRLVLVLGTLAAGAAQGQAGGGGHAGGYEGATTGLERSFAISAPSGVKALAPKTAPAAVPLTVLAVPFPIANAEDAEVALVVEAGGPELVAGAETNDLHGVIEVAAVDANGKIADQFSQPFALDGADDSILHGGLKLYAVLRLQPGDYTLRAKVENGATTAHGSHEQPLRVPDFARAEATLSPPLLPDGGNWRVFRQSDSPHESLPYPFVDSQGNGFLPAAAPALPPGGGNVVVYAYGPVAEPQRVAGKLVAASGKSAPAKVTLVETGMGRFTIQKRLLLRLDGPLPTGAHRLELEVAGAAASAETRTALMVRTETPAQPALAIATADADQPRAEEPAALAAGWTRQQLGARFQEALGKAAAGDLDRAVRALADLEAAATPLRTYGQAKALREVERDTLAAAGAQSAGLLPVIYLYSRLDGELLRRNEPWLAAQNRLWVGELVARWVKTQPDPPVARHVAAQLLAALGSTQEALGYEPTNELALLRLATSAEKGALYAIAAEQMRKLVHANPESYHGKLRLAVLLRRQGNAAEAAPLFAELISAPKAPHWVAELACQQLAEIERGRGQEEQAEATLKQGIETLKLQSLYLQLAYYLDERQRPEQAVAVLNGMPVTAGPSESSARSLYNGQPDTEIALARQQVEARVAGEWPQLRASLVAAAAAPQGSR